MRGDVNNMSAENRAYPRLLFCSYHCYPDPSSGAALATRDLLELLAARGWACGVLSGPRLDAEAVPRLEQLLHDHGLSFEAHAAPGGANFRLYNLPIRGVPVTLYEPPTQGNSTLPIRAGADDFLRVLDGVMDRFRPDLLLTYGGDDLAREVIARAKRRGRAVVFCLHNFAYHDAALFRPVDAVWTPSRFARITTARRWASIARPSPTCSTGLASAVPTYKAAMLLSSTRSRTRA